LGEEDAKLVRQRIGAVVQSKIPHVVFEMSGVLHINSAGLAGLVMAHVTMARAGGTAQFTNVGENVAKVLTITRLDRVFAVVPTVEEAIVRWEKEA
jgi:anti-anti-sigma factor